MCSVPSTCSRNTDGAGASPRPEQPRRAGDAAVGVGQDLARGARSARSDRSSVPAPRSSPRRGGRARGLGDPDVEADVGPPVASNSPPRPSSRPAPRADRVPALRALGGVSVRAGLDATRSRAPPRLLAEHSRARSASGGCSATKVPPAAPPARDEVAALHQRRQAWRRVEREIPSWPGELALRRQPAARRQQAEPYRGAEALDRLLEGRRGPNRLNTLRSRRRDPPSKGNPGGVPCAANALRCTTPVLIMAALAPRMREEVAPRGLAVVGIVSRRAHPVLIWATTTDAELVDGSAYALVSVATAAAAMAAGAAGAGPTRAGGDRPGERPTAAPRAASGGLGRLRAALLEEVKRAEEGRPRRRQPVSS